MPKVEKASMEYVVSFNCTFDGVEMGGEDMFSEDYQGDDIDSLAQEVCKDDPNYPLTFMRDDNEDSVVVGWFFHEYDENSENNHPDAVMVKLVDF